MTREVLLVAMCGLQTASCSSGKDATSLGAIASDRSTGAPKNADDRGPIVAIRTERGLIEVAVEVARTPSQIRQGLMHRHHLPAQNGMLFVLEREELQSFWMKNTLISLDLIFIRSDMIVAGVVANAPPQTLDSQSIGVPSRFVLEVNAGWAAANGVGPGAAVQFRNIDSGRHTPANMPRLATD